MIDGYYPPFFLALEVVLERRQFAIRNPRVRRTCSLVYSVLQQTGVVPFPGQLV